MRHRPFEASQQANLDLEGFGRPTCVPLRPVRVQLSDLDQVAPRVIHLGGRDLSSSGHWSASDIVVN